MTRPREAGLGVDEVYRDESLCVLHVDGVLGVRSAPVLRRALVKALLQRAPVIADVTDLTVAWLPATHTFAAAVRSCGGWPDARLVVVTPEGRPGEGRARVAAGPTVHTAPDLATARRVVAHRPARVTRSHELPARASSPRRARRLVEDACAAWAVEDRLRIAAVASELVTNCVLHARSGCTLSLTLDRRGFTVAVDDPLPPGDGAWQVRDGLRLVAELSRAWGVRQRGNGGKAVWATVPAGAP